MVGGESARTVMRGMLAMLANRERELTVGGNACVCHADGSVGFSVLGRFSDGAVGGG